MPKYTGGLRPDSLSTSLPEVVMERPDHSVKYGRLTLTPLQRFQGGDTGTPSLPQDLQHGCQISAVALVHSGGGGRVQTRWFRPGRAEPGGAVLFR